MHTEEDRHSTDADGRREAWPNRRIIYLAVVVTVVVYTVFHLLPALDSILGVVSSTLILLMLSIAMAYVLLPIVDLLTRLKWPANRSSRRVLYSIVAIILFIVVLGGLLTLIVTPLAEQVSVAVETLSEWVSDDLASTLDHAVDRLVAAVPDEYQADVRRRIEKVKNDLDGAQTGDLLQQWGGTFLQSQLELLKTILTTGAYIVGLVVVPIFAYYFLTDATTIREGVERHIPDTARSEFNRTVTDIDCVLREYVKMMLVVSSLTGIATAAVLYFTGVPVYLALGVLAGVGSLIPVVGSVVAVLVVMIVSLLTVDPVRALIVLLVYGGIQIGTDRILAPKLMSKGVELHPVAIIIALMVGGQFFGAVGVFIAVPALATLRMIYIHTRSYIDEGTHREELDEMAGPKEAEEDADANEQPSQQSST
jgi:predicted PurR-regulated permease PerM